MTEGFPKAFRRVTEARNMTNLTEMNESEKEIFHFKRFDIAQENCAMKVGTDGVLLGAATPLPPSNKPLRILDIGTGTGLVALLLAQRLSEAGRDDFAIEAVEIDNKAAQQAKENFDASPWGKKISVHACSLQDYLKKLGNDTRFDLIISNPPFYNATLKPEDEARSTARHMDSLPVREIAECAANHLTDNGLLSLIYPTSYDTEVMSQAIVKGLTPTHIWNILTKEGKPCKRKITTFRSARSSGMDAEAQNLPLTTSILALRDAAGNYTEEYRKLTDSFYVSLR